MKSRNRVLVIGAGAAGMMAALQAARKGAEVTVAEGNDRVGKKIYATGNGRCNLTNVELTAANGFGHLDALAGSEAEAAEEGERIALIEEVIGRFTADDALNFFEECGVLCRIEDAGRCYPASGQAATVAVALADNMDKAGVQLITGDPVVALTRKDGDQADSQADQADCSLGSDSCSGTGGGYEAQLASGKRVFAEKVIIACGGRAGLKFGSTGDGYGFAKAFGHSLVPPRPALTAVESDEFWLADLKGVRVKGQARLITADAVIAQEEGEIQFTGTGVSGICVFDLTRHMEAPRPSKKRKNKGTPEAGSQKGTISNIIEIDCAPDFSEDKLLAFITAEMEKGNDLASALSGAVNSKLAAVIAGLATGEPGFNGGPVVPTETQAGGAPADGVDKAVKLIKALRVRVSGTRGWDDAQTTRGGVRLTEVDYTTMESKLSPGLFLCGEVLDADGRCGGYNLQWAWSTGWLAGGGATAE